jgi:hypothetical protein
MPFHTPNQTITTILHLLTPALLRKAPTILFPATFAYFLSSALTFFSFIFPQEPSPFDTPVSNNEMYESLFSSVN